MVIKLLVFLGRILAFLLALIFCLPILLTPLATAVPAWVWIPLAAAGLGLLVAFFWIKPTWKATFVSLAGILIVAVLAVAASQAFAMTPPILDANGKPLPGSIATLETVTLNGSRQWISIRGKDTTKPVLLFLARAARRQSTDHRAFRPGWVGGAFRGCQLGTAWLRQILRCCRPFHHHTRTI